MMGTFTNANESRLLLHINDGPEIRFINDKTGDVVYRKMTWEELERMANWANHVLEHKEELKGL